MARQPVAQYVRGFVDPLSLIAVGFLLVTTIVGGFVINKSGISFNPNKEAASTSCEQNGFRCTSPVNGHCPGGSSYDQSGNCNSGICCKEYIQESKPTCSAPNACYESCPSGFVSQTGSCNTGICCGPIVHTPEPQPNNTNPETQNSTTSASSCVTEGGFSTSGTGHCCSGLVQTDCVAAGSFSYCKCTKETTVTQTQNQCTGTCYHANTCSSIGRDKASGSCSKEDYVCCGNVTITTTTTENSSQNQSTLPACRSCLNGSCVRKAGSCNTELDECEFNSECPNIQNNVAQVPTGALSTPSTTSFLNTHCDDICQTDSDCGVNQFCYKTAVGCPYCKTKNSVCPAGSTVCSEDTIKTCNATGTAWVPTETCTYGCYEGQTVGAKCAPGCDGNRTGTIICSAPSEFSYCNLRGEWASTKCPANTSCSDGKCVISMPPTEEGWHYVCSIGGDFSFYTNDRTLDVSWDKSRRCSKGCQNGACIGEIVDIYACANNQTSLDGFEECKDGWWQCIPGKTRRLVYPGQNNMADSMLTCNSDRTVYTTYIKTLDSLKCNSNNLVDLTGQIVAKCGTYETCLDKNEFSFVSLTGCYSNNFVNINDCKDGDIIEPKEPLECKQVCENHRFVPASPPECVRDTKFTYPKICHDNSVWQSGVRIQNCGNTGCSYGQCVPKENASCTPSQSYIDSATKCLFTCVDAKYQKSNVCIDTYKIDNNWDNNDLLILLNVINEFPDMYTEALKKVRFTRLEDVYIYAKGMVASGQYLPSVKTIETPDSGVNTRSIGHEIMHAISFSDKKIIENYIETTGCRQDPANPNGPYLYSEAPFTEYGHTNCEEGLAETCGDEYTDSLLSCAMKTARPAGYNFCKNQVFGGKEFCDTDNNQGGLIKKLMKPIATMFTITVHAAESLPYVVPNTIEAKLSTLVPGKTNSGDLESIIGQPEDKLINGDTTIYTYPSSDKSRSHLVYIKDNKVIFVQLVLDNENVKYSVNDVIKQYGEPTDMSYSTHSHDSPVYSYPSKGISFLIDGSSQQVFMIQAYTPTTETIFKQTVGKDFTDKPFMENFEEADSIRQMLATTKVEKTSSNKLLSTNNLVIIIITFLALSVLVIVFRKRIFKRREKYTKVDILPKEPEDIGW